MIPITNITGRLGNQMFQHAYMYAQARSGEIPDIYVQDPCYFDEYADEIKAIYGEGIGRVDQVAIHVRRGLNPSNPTEPKYSENMFYINLMDTDYYERAMAEFPNESFVVFSDDIGWCKEQDIFRDCTFSEGNNEITDMNLMASCKGVIMANSSFSWWAAFLSKGKVVAPKAWYADGVIRTKLLNSWTQL